MASGHHGIIPLYSLPNPLLIKAHVFDSFAIESEGQLDHSVWRLRHRGIGVFGFFLHPTSCSVVSVLHVSYPRPGSPVIHRERHR